MSGTLRRMMVLRCLAHGSELSCALQGFCLRPFRVSGRMKPRLRTATSTGEWLPHAGPTARGTSAALPMTHQPCTHIVPVGVLQRQTVITPVNADAS